MRALMQTHMHAHISSSFIPHIAQITEYDECSKRVCKLCFDKVTDFWLHHKTVLNTQKNIQSYIDLQREAQVSPWILFQILFILKCR